jgi:hypothetical protein
MTGSRKENNSQGEWETSENITIQMTPEQHENCSQTTSHFLVHTPFITEQQQQGTEDFEDSSKSYNITVDMKNGLNTYPEEDTYRSEFQQTEYKHNTEEMQKYSSSGEQSGTVIVFPWNMAGTSDSTELEDVYLIYPEDGDENDTAAWDWMNDDNLLLRHMSELQLFNQEHKKSTNFTETPKVSSIIKDMIPENIDIPEKEYLVASHSAYNGIRAPEEMEENLEDEGEAEEDGEEQIVDEDNNNNSSNNGNNENQAESLTRGHALTHHMQNKSMYVPKRSFVSENLKMRISQLATTEGRHGPRGKPAADKVQNTNSHYRTGQRSSPSSHAMRVNQKQSIIRINRLPGRSPLPDTTASARPLQQLSSNAKKSTGIPENPTAIPHASRTQNPLSRQFNGNCSEEAATDINGTQRGSHPQQGSIRCLLQQGDSETLQQRQTYLRENSATKPTHAEAIQTSKSENTRPADRREVTEMLHGTFGARTRTRERPPSFKTSPSPSHANTDGGTGSVITNFVHNQQTGQSDAEPHPSKLEGPPSPVTATTVKSPGSDTRESVNRHISVEGAGLIHVVGPIPKGFTDPVTLQNMDSVNQRDPLFHLPYNIPPQPFQNQISNSQVPQFLVSVTPSSSGVSSFNPDVRVLHHPQAQSLHQHEALRPVGNHSPQNHVQTIMASPTAPSISNSGIQKWQQIQNWLPPKRTDLDAPPVPSALTADKFNLPSIRNLAEFNKLLTFHLPTPNDPQKNTSTSVPVAVTHSSPPYETVAATINPLSQTSPHQKFLSFSEQQLKQLTEQKESLMSLNTHGSQLSTKLPAEGHPMPLLARHQQDAQRHTAALEYTRKLQEYFHQLQTYYNQQPHK